MILTSIDFIIQMHEKAPLITWCNFKIVLNDSMSRLLKCAEARRNTSISEWFILFKMQTKLAFAS